MAYKTVQNICFMQEKLTHKSRFTSIMTNPNPIEDLTFAQYPYGINPLNTKGRGVDPTPPKVFPK